ncbi:unnamed protein product, partial [Allacma fusca]
KFQSFHAEMTVVSGYPGFFRSTPRNSSLFLSTEVFSSTDPPLTLAPRHTDVKFRLSAKNLDKKDIFGTSDPYVVVSYMADKVNGEIPLGTTSTIQDNVNPKWGEGFRIRYESGTNQRLHFVIWDKDAGEDDKIADITVRLGELVRSNGQMHIPLAPGFLLIEKA